VCQQSKAFLMSALHVCYKFYFEPTEITHCFFYPLLLVVALSTLFLLLFLRFLQSSKKREYDVAVILTAKWQSACTHSFREQKKECSQLKYTSNE
jgi:hypothetical protein